MSKLNSDFITKENAEIWCLRVALWQHHHKLQDDESDTDPQIPQLEEEERPLYRGKRGARIIRRIAPRGDMTQPPTGFRIRREYRSLSLTQRNRFHDALNVLYEVGFCQQNADLYFSHVN